MIKLKKEYFKHDYHARADLTSLQAVHGLAGVGLYWCIIEVLHERKNAIKAEELATLAYNLHASEQLMHGVIYDSGLFDIEDGIISNQQVASSLKHKRNISIVRQEAADARWGKPPVSQRVINACDNLNAQFCGQAPSPGEKATAVEREAQETQATVERGAYRAEQYREIFKTRLDEFESRSIPDGIIWKCRAPFEGVIEAVAKRERFKISGQYVKSDDILYVLQYFVQDDNALGELERILAQANSKTARGSITNKLNYLVTALYQVAKLGGW